MVKYWHTFWLRHNEALLEGCLCEIERSRIFDKYGYHERKFNALVKRKQQFN